MIGGRKAHIFVVALGRKIRRIAIKKAHLAVLCRDEFLEILILDHDLLKPPRSLFNQREITPHTVRLSAETVAPACVTVTDKLIKIRGSLHIADLGFFADDVLDLILSISLDTIYAKNFSKFLLIPPKYPRSVSGVDIWAGGLRCGV